MQPTLHPAAPETLPLCPVHLERPSVATCERCGRFLCEACAVSREPAHCAECHTRLGDPLGVLAEPFSVGGSLSRGWVLFRQALPGLVLVSCLFGLPGGYVSYLVDQSSEGVTASLRWSRLFEGTLGLIAVGAHLALLVGVAEGRPLSVGRALREGLSAWPRLFSANFRSGLLILLFSLLLIVPGIIKAVTLVLVAQVAYREPGTDALNTSTRLVTGRRWEVFGMMVACYLLIFALVVPVSALLGYLAAQVPATGAVGEILIDAWARLSDAFSTAVVLAAFYGFKRLHGEELAPLSRAG